MEPVGQYLDVQSDCPVSEGVRTVGDLTESELGHDQRGPKEMPPPSGVVQCEMEAQSQLK